MNNDNPQLMKELQHPTAKYDYDGITGTWLLIPAKFHILMLAIATPVIIWMFPFIHLKGNYRYIFADYRFYIAGAVALFCIASAILSIIKAKQVRYRIRPIGDVNRQSVTKSSATRHKKSTTPEKQPKIHVGHIKRSLNPLPKIKNKESQKKGAGTSQPSKEKVADVITTGVIKTAVKKAAASSSPKPQTAPKPSAEKQSTKKNDSTTQKPKKTSTDSAPSKRRKNPKQMQLDL